MPKYLYAENVTEQEVSELDAFKQRGVREFVRGRIIELSASGAHPQVIADAIGLSVGRVREWIRRFNRHRIEGLIAKKSPGRPRQFKESVRDKIRAIVGDAPQDYGISKSRWTLSDICQVSVAEGLVDTISKEQVRRLFIEVGWTYTRAKKWQPSPDKQYRRRRNRQRRLEQWALDDESIALLYWDQFWRNLLHLPMAKSYSPRGDFQRVAPNQRVKVSIYLAMDYRTRYVHHFYQPRCKSDYTIDSLKRWIREYASYRALIIIWDKAPWHTSEKVSHFVKRWNRYAKSHGKVRLLILRFPTKAPWLNPLEAVISMIIRHGLQNKTHQSVEAVTTSVSNYIQWRNFHPRAKAA
jgi:transposase